MQDFEVKRIVRDLLDDYFTEKDCPHCHSQTTCIKVVVWSDESDASYWRCLKCLKLFEEKLQEVK